MSEAAAVEGAHRPAASQRCPLCGQRCRSARGVLQHCRDVHKKPQHAERIEAFRAEFGGADDDLGRRLDLGPRTPRQIVADLKADGMRCTCCHAIWDTEDATGHTWGCALHHAAMMRFDEDRK